MAVQDFAPMTFNPKYGRVGMVSWAGMFLFEYLAPVIEFLGWVVVPTAFLLGALNPTSLIAMLVLAFAFGLLNSILALMLDEAFGYFNRPVDTFRLITMALIENLGFRQMTVFWRIRALVGGESTKSWGNMERRGVAQLAD